MQKKKTHRGIAQNKEVRKQKIIQFLAKQGVVQRKDIWHDKSFNWRKNNRLLIECLNDLEKENVIVREKRSHKKCFYSLAVDKKMRDEIQNYMVARDNMFEKVRDSIKNASTNLNRVEVRNFFEAFIYSMLLDFVKNQTNMVDNPKFPILTKEIILKFDIEDFNMLLKDFYTSNPSAFEDVLEEVFYNLRLLRKVKWPASEELTE